MKTDFYEELILDEFLYWCRTRHPKNFTTKERRMIDDYFNQKNKRWIKAFVEQEEKENGR